MGCPSPDQLKQFALTGHARDLSVIEAHLSDCTECQRLLERFVSLASDQSLWQLKTDPANEETSAIESDGLIGCDLDGYFILERAGSGSSGTVYRALQEATDRIVAIKIMAGRGFSDRQVANWRRESRLVARIQNTNVISILDAGKSMGYAYCVFEWIDGGSLADQLKRFQFEFHDAAKVAFGIAKGCAALHKERILHRDIKPSNVLVDQTGRVKLADFGIAYALDETMTMTSQGNGTPGFMSPEQLGLISRSIDERTDVYGIGAVIYAMLVGRGPFTGSNVLEVVSNAASHDIRSPSSERPVPKALETICLKCLEKRPESRYENAEALAEDLSRFLDGRPILARPPTVFQRTNKWMRSNVRTLAVAVLLMIGITSFWIGQAIRSQQSQRQIARERLTQVLEVDASGLPRALERFSELQQSHRKQALQQIRVNDSPQKRLRILLTSNPSGTRLLEFASEHASDLPVNELTEIFLRLQHAFETGTNRSLDIPGKLQETLKSDRASISETELVELALVASAAPEELNPDHLRRISLGLEGNGKLHAQVWRTGFASIADGLNLQIIQNLSGEGEVNKEVQLEYGFLFGLDSPNPSRAKSIAQILFHCPAENLVEFTNRLPVKLKNGVASELRSKWQESSLMDREVKNATQTYPTDLLDIKNRLEKYQAICTKEVLLLPVVPLADWSDLARRLDSSNWSVLEFRPTVIDGNEIAAVTLAKRKHGVHDLTIDVPESKVESLSAQQADQGLYPLSVWARPARNEELENLLVTIVWGRSQTPQQVRFDELPDDWEIDVQNISRSNYQDANRFFLLELGRHEDVGATQAAARKAQARNRLEVEEVVTARRTVGLLRDRIESAQVESQEEDLRIQTIAQTRMPTVKIGVIERNFKFQSRPRKLALEASSPNDHRIRCERLLQLGFLPESCSATASKSGELAITSRWSASYSKIDPKRDDVLAAAVLGSFLLGDANPLTEAFGCDLDRSVASLVCSFGAHLQPRHSAWIARELREHNNDSKVLYSLALMVGYMQKSAITEELKTELNRLAKFSTHAGVLGALSKSGHFNLENLELSPAPEGEASVIDGQLILEIPRHPMVHIAPQNQMAFLGGERFMLWSSSAYQNLVHQSYQSFAIGIRPVTFRQYHEYQKATNQKLKTLPATCRSVDCPAVEIPYHETLKYCRWLSEQAGIPDHEIGLPPIDQIGPEMRVENLTRSKGYRLPTEYEWEMASRAGAYTDRFFGHADRLLLDYANIANPSQFTMLPVGKLNPNPYGLFDCYGNCLEMCLHKRHGGPVLEIPERMRQVRTNILVAGGSFLTHSMYASAGAKLSVTENSADMQVGFRVARTIEF